MKLDDVRKIVETDVRNDSAISVRLPKKAVDWMSDHEVSPTKLFRKALEEVGYKEV